MDGYSEHETYEPRSASEIVTASMCLAVLIFITVIGNITVIVAATTYHKLIEQQSTLFIINLAVADLLVAFLIMLSSLVTVSLDIKPLDVTKTSLAKALCSVQCAINYCLIVVSMMTLGFISIDRYLHVVHPMRYGQLMTVGRIKVMLAWTWVQGLIIGFTPVSMQWINYDYYEIVCAIYWPSERADTYVIVACITCFLAPGLTMLICYSIIFKEIHKSMSRVPQNSIKQRRDSSSSSNDQMKNYTKQKTSANQHQKIIRSLLVVVIIFFFCMTPFCVTKLIKVLEGRVAGWINTLATFVQLTASACNPFIYGIFRTEFRKAFKSQYSKLIDKLGCSILRHDLPKSGYGGAVIRIMRHSQEIKCHQSGQNQEKKNGVKRLATKYITDLNQLTTTTDRQTRGLISNSPQPTTDDELKLRAPNRVVSCQHQMSATVSTTVLLPTLTEVQVI
ncbi:D(1) dopamine receptor-like [Watersipora subatra]|uniref:D(1) dopamine receptor-like n=1 Tax=Watersipora subatra TaxID=2589382 RepID=UPI00355BD4F5